MARAKEEFETSKPSIDPVTEAKASQLADLQNQLRIAGRRMATEENNDRYEVLARQREEIQGELMLVQQQLEQLRKLQPPKKASSAPETEVKAALAVLNDIGRVAADATARDQIPPLLDALGVRIGLTFGTTIWGNKRKVQRLLGGVVAFGGTPLPVPIHGHNNCEDHDLTETKEPAASASRRTSSVPTAKGDGGMLLPSTIECHLEGISFTKVSRGDRRCIFPNDIVSGNLFGSAIAQTIEFSAVAFTSDKP
jgi:hypothetical protein